MGPKQNERHIRHLRKVLHGRKTGEPFEKGIFWIYRIDFSSILVLEKKRQRTPRDLFLRGGGSYQGYAPRSKKLFQIRGFRKKFRGSHKRPLFRNSSILHNS